MDSDQVTRTVALVVMAVLFGGFVLWWGVVTVRDYYDGIRAMQRAVEDLPALLGHRQAEDAQREALLELGLTEAELDHNHSVVNDPQTGWSTTVYFFSRAEIEAKADAMLRRYAAALGLAVKGSC